MSGPWSDRLVVDTATPADVEMAVEWAAREGWNPGRSDAACFHAADPDGFLVGRIDSEPVSVISAVRYRGGFAFVGLYIVAPRWRGLGLGWATWSAAMQRLDGLVVGLDGVVEQQANYARSGFALAHRNVRYGGAPDRRALATAAGDRDARVLGAGDLPGIAGVDRVCFGFERPAFLAAWIAQPGATVVGVRDGDDLTGYAVARPCRTGMKVGPLFADTVADAAALLDLLMAESDVPGPVFWDVPQPHAGAVGLAERAGLAPVFETARMYRGGDPGLPLHRIFGITTFELG